MNFQRTFILSFFLNILDILEHLARQNILAGTECQLLEKQITRPSWWHLSGVWAERFSKLLNFWPRTKKKPGKAGEVVPRLDFWAASVFDPFWSIMSLAEDIQLIAGGNRWHWHKWKIIGNNFQHREFGAFPENISENDENFKNKIYRGGQWQCWWFLLLLRWFSVPLLSVPKNTHFYAIQEHFKKYLKCWCYPGTLTHRMSGFGQFTRFPLIRFISCATFFVCYFNIFSPLF